jgi:hypothetical protein
VKVSNGSAARNLPLDRYAVDFCSTNPRAQNCTSDLAKCDTLWSAGRSNQSFWEISVLDVGTCRASWYDCCKDIVIVNHCSEAVTKNRRNRCSVRIFRLSQVFEHICFPCMTWTVQRHELATFTRVQRRHWRMRRNDPAVSGDRGSTLQQLCRKVTL